MVESMVKRAQKNDIQKWRKKFAEVKDSCQNEWKVDMTKVNALSLLKKLREILPSNRSGHDRGRSVPDVGLASLQCHRAGTFFSSTGLGTMGFGFPAAIGAKVAAPNRPVLDIAGDGSFNMTEAALATSVLDNIPVIVVILNNTMLGMVAQWQRLFYQRRYHGVKLYGIPDYVKLAEAYRAQGLRAQSIDEFAGALKLGLRSDVTTVIDVRSLRRRMSSRS